MTENKLKRKFDCMVCGEPVTAERIINGWIINCGCGPIHTTFDLLECSWYKPVVEEK